MLYYQTVCVIMTLMKPLNKQIKDRRIASRLSQDAVASFLGVTRTAVVMIEQGKRKVSADELMLLCSLFACSADDLLFGKRPAKAENPLFSQFLTLSKKDREEIADLIAFKKRRGRSVAHG